MASIRPIRPRLKIVSLPAPIGGWNARDAYAEMAPTDAVTLINYFPTTTSVVLRFGYSQFATGMTGQCETVMSYSGAGTSKFFSANSGGRIYNITAGGAIGSADVSGMTNGRWQYINVATTGGNYLMAVNGADKARYFDGSAWDSDGAASLTITGVNSASCIGINLFKNRVWLIEQNTLKAWYLPTGAVAGAANSLDLRAFCPHGGSMVAMGTWTIDAGYGVDDYAVFLTSKGDVICYRGSDPSSAATWSMIGQFYVGSPVGNRPFVKWKGDLLLICQDGVFPLSAALQSSRLNPRVAITDKINKAMTSAVGSYGANFGWQLMPFPKQNMLVLNVPVQAGATQEQYVTNTITGAWGQFQQWEANCWELFNDDLYFGGNTYVGKAWNTNADIGAAINGFILQAFNTFKEPGQRKRVASMRPLFLTNGTPAIFGGVNWDYDLSNASAALSTTATTFAVWDTAVWDSGLWGGGLTPNYKLQNATGSGWAGAPVFKSATNGLQLELVSNDLSLEIGGFL